MKKKIRISLTMTDEQAWWLIQLLELDCEEAPHYKFFERIRGVVIRARNRNP